MKFVSVGCSRELYQTCIISIELSPGHQHEKCQYFDQLIEK